MNVLIVIGTLGLGGAERVSINLARWLISQPNMCATIVALSKAKDKSYPTNGLDCIELDNKNPIAKLRSVVKKRKIDLVLTMCTPLCVFTIPALFGLKVKHVVSERNDPAQFAGRKITRFLSRALMRLADGYVFQTCDAQSYYGRSISRKSVVIPNPLLDFGDTNVQVYEGSDTKTIVSVGRLNRQKNQLLLIDAFYEIFKQHPEYHLIVYGEGPERQHLENRIRQYGISDVCMFPGSTNQIFEKIHNASMFVLSSNFEGMPNALMEAMALGIPCISTDCSCGGPRELISNEENGLLVPVDDKDALVNAMEKFINDVQFAKRMGRNAMEIRVTHSLDLICRKWLDFFKSI